MTTLPYDLAKQLKKAGYPQKDSGTDGGRLLWEPGIYWPSEPDIKAGRFAYSPSLSELIAACPRMIEGCSFDLYAPIDCNEWCAGYGGSPEGNGATPEEATAKLWLALKGKNIAG